MIQCLILVTTLALRDRRALCLWINRKCWLSEEKRFYLHNPSHSAGPWRWRQTALNKQKNSLRGVDVWHVNSTVTKHSDCFIWKNASERDSTLRRTSWQEASEFLCIKTPPFLRDFSNKKIRQKTQKCSLRRDTNVTFSNAASAAKKNRGARGFLNPHFARFKLIN